VAVTLQGISISAACPGTVAVDQNVQIQGRADYDLVNDGGDQALVDILAELVDSAGNGTTDSQTNRTIAAGGRESVHHVLSLSASYEQSGRVGVTMRVTVSGALGGSQAAECGFVVGEP
jgi:hypothetical protein